MGTTEGYATLAQGHKKRIGGGESKVGKREREREREREKENEK